MRTTLSIDDDVLERVRRQAVEQRRPIGAVVSDLLRWMLSSNDPLPVYRNGILLLPNREGVTVTPELVKELGEESHNPQNGSKQS